ncbi:MAG: Rpn family recombination-promoting nuclease/putative transposase [Lachnospiraceae bacterium]|nr:Rpn family recombination-promoting nuclease/putative transposase [Lachnospiraceae bacterium]
MKNPELCRKVLETLLQRPIGELTVCENEKTVKITKDGKAIRLDIFAKEKDSNTQYDAEMQNLNNKSLEDLSLAKRSRYYQAIVDMQSLNEKSNYRNLGDSNIIFICTFDPFGKNSPLYTFTERCEEYPEMELESGIKKLFFNTKASDLTLLPKDMEALYNYINTGKADDELTEELDDAVKVARMDAELRGEYMRTDLFIQDAIYEGVKIGEEKGEKKGREEGREEGRSEGIRGVIDIMLEMNCPETDIISRLMKTFGLSEEEAKTRYYEYVASNVIS